MRERVKVIVMLGLILAAGMMVAATTTPAKKKAQPRLKPVYINGSIKATVVINAPVEKVFAWVVDPANQIKRVPYQTLTNLHGPGLGAGHNFYAKTDMGVFEGEVIIVQYVPNQLWVEKTMTGGDGTGNYTWMFFPEGNQTRIVKVCEISKLIPSSGLAMTKEKAIEMFQKGQNDELNLIKAEIEKK